jgi:hypothetical protein
MKASSAQPLLHQTVTSLSGGNSAFSKLKEQGWLYLSTVAEWQNLMA